MTTWGHPTTCSRRQGQTTTCIRLTPLGAIWLVKHISHLRYVGDKKGHTTANPPTNLLKARPTDHWRGPNAGTETGLVASITPVTALVRLSPSLVPRLFLSLMATWTKASPSPSSSSLTSELNQLSMADHTDTVDQGAQYAKSIDDVREGQSSANGNGQPTPKRARVPLDQALPEDEIVVNKRAKPNLSEACAKAYKDLRNKSVRLARFENQRDYYKKILGHRCSSSIYEIQQCSLNRAEQQWSQNSLGRSRYKYAMKTP